MTVFIRYAQTNNKFDSDIAIFKSYFVIQSNHAGGETTNAIENNEATTRLRV